MSTEENKAIVHRFISEVLNKGNMAVADKLMAPKLLHHCLAPEVVLTREEYKQNLISVREAIPDCRFTCEDMLAEGDQVVVRWALSGTQRGRLVTTRGIFPPTGKTWQSVGLTVYRIIDGQIVEWGKEFDIISLLRQLDLISISPLNIDPLPGMVITTQGFGASDGDPSTCKNKFTPAKDSTDDQRVLWFTNVVNLYWGNYYKQGNPGYAKRYWIDDRAEFVFNDNKFWAPLKEYSTSDQTIEGGTWVVDGEPTKG